MKRLHHEITIWTAAVLAAISLQLAAGETTAQNPAQPSSIPGHVLPVLRRARAVGETSKKREVDIGLILNIADRAALDQRIEQLYDPASPLFHRFATAGQFADEFGPSQSDYDTVVRFLQDSGFQVTATYPNRLLIEARGNIAQVEQTFRVRINDYLQDGRVFFANDRDPSLPSHIAAAVASVRGIENYLELRRHTRAHPARRYSSRAPTGYSPQQIAGAYDFTSAYNAGITGRGEIVAIATAYGFSATDVANFWSYYGIKAPKVSAIAVGGKPRSTDIETTLDLERAGAMANGASFIVYEAANPRLSTFEAVYYKIVSDNKASVVTTSWGLCEPEMPAAYLSADSAIFAEAAAQGQAWFAASGDDGASDCGTSALAADYPSSDPNVTAVGGTTLVLGDNGAIAAESAWVDSGGGLSAVFGQPFYQIGSGVLNASSNGMRQTADVAFNGDPATGYSVYFNRSWWELGGTSFGAPQWAAIFALANSAHGSRLGAAGPALYGLANNNPAQAYPAFRDILSGDNGFYPAADFWDYPTGWGSPMVWNLLRDLQ